MHRLIATSITLGLVAFGARGAGAQIVEFGEIPAQLVEVDVSQTVPGAGDFERRGEAEFKAGHYSSAVQAWRHALVDDPKNGGVVLMLSQGLFAVGQYDEAAGAVEFAFTLLPAEKWGTVVSRYKEIYGNIQDYTEELKRLEKARDATPTSPAIRFLLGYHFGFLGFPRHAVRELNKALELAPKDDTARKLIEIFKPEIKDGGAQQPPTPSEEKQVPPTVVPPTVVPPTVEKSAPSAEAPASSGSPREGSGAAAPAGTSPPSSAEANSPTEAPRSF